MNKTTEQIYVLTRWAIINRGVAGCEQWVSYGAGMASESKESIIRTHAKEDGGILIDRTINPEESFEDYCWRELGKDPWNYTEYCTISTLPIV